MLLTWLVKNMYPRYVSIQLLLLASILVWLVCILVVTNKTTQEYIPPYYDPPLSDHPIPSLAAVSAIPPPMQSDPTCHPPPLPAYPECDEPGLTGDRLHNPRKLVLMVLFSFEVDTLEIMLKEVQDMVDFIFIVEGSTTHRGVCII